MKALIYRAFGGSLTLETVSDPTPSPDGVVAAVRATGLCRSDWHGWKGNDPDVRLPHVPGHELAGVVEEIGPDVSRWKRGDRITVPFVGGCGTCGPCESGNEQVCDRQFQPGFTHWGAFAERVAIDHADVNLVRLPDRLDFVPAAALGCRFGTAFRALVDQARVRAGDWVAVHGCGGVGLSAILIARAIGARVVAIDIDPETLALARDLGATATVLGQSGPTESVAPRSPLSDPVAESVHEITGGGADISMDALGSPATCRSSIAGLRKRGTHLQVGIMPGSDHDTPIPMDLVIGRELEILGSHGIQAHRYPALFELVTAKKIDLSRLVGRTISLEEAGTALPEMDRFSGRGVTVVDRF